MRTTTDHSNVGADRQAFGHDHRQRRAHYSRQNRKSRCAACVGVSWQALPVAAHMFDLPSVPRFPVYGLDPRFDGYRWLVTWNERDFLYTVSLGHGQPGGGRDDGTMRRAGWLTVSTYLKTPLRQINDGALIAKGPTGYADAMFGALHGIGEAVFPRGADAANWVADEINLVDWGSADQRDAPKSHGPKWDVDTTEVDARLHPSFSRRLNGWWATLVDLATVAVAITGPDSSSDVGASIVDVRDRLADYN